RRSQVVDDQSPHHPAKVAQRILQPPDEVLGGLPPEDLSIALARVAQDHAQDMRSAPPPVLHHPGTLAKIDLRLLARRGFDAAKRQWTGLLQLPHIPLHRVVAAFKLLLRDQILINPLSRQTPVQPRLNGGFKRLALADASGLRAGGRNGWVWT